MCPTWRARSVQRRQEKGGQIIVEQWPAWLLPRSPFTLCKRTPEALRISKHETYPLVLALETTRATKLFRNFIIRLIASTAIFHSASPLQNSNRKDDFSSENL